MDRGDSMDREGSDRGDSRGDGDMRREGAGIRSRGGDVGEEITDNGKICKVSASAVLKLKRRFNSCDCILFTNSLIVWRLS